MRVAVRLQCASQVGFDFAASHIVVIIELHADASGTVTLGAFRRNPNHFTCHGDFLCLVHQVQQHENLILQLIFLLCGYKETTVAYERHISSIKHGFVFDRQRQDAVAHAFFSTYRLEFLAEAELDNSDPDVLRPFGVVLNEMAVRALGFEDAQEAAGEVFFFNGAETLILAVVPDYHHTSLKDPIVPMIFQYEDSAPGYFTLRFASGADQEAIKRQVKTAWASAFAGDPLIFVSPVALYNQPYTSDARLLAVLTLFSVLALFISVLGLTGLAWYTAGSRVKEIGIRKV